MARAASRGAAPAPLAGAGRFAVHLRTGQPIVPTAVRDQPRPALSVQLRLLPELPHPVLRQWVLRDRVHPAAPNHHGLARRLRADPPVRVRGPRRPGDVGPAPPHRDPVVRALGRRPVPPGPRRGVLPGEPVHPDGGLVARGGVDRELRLPALAARRPSPHLLGGPPLLGPRERRRPSEPAPRARGRRRLRHPDRVPVPGGHPRAEPAGGPGPGRPTDAPPGVRHPRDAGSGDARLDLDPLPPDAQPRLLLEHVRQRAEPRRHVPRGVQYTVPWNTFRMLGFSWIYAAPNAYPWIGWLLLLAVAGTLGVFAYLVGVVWLRRYPGFGLLWLGTLLLLVLSFGDNPPLGGVDLWLLNRHGPFLLLVDPYYLILEPWVIMVCLAVFVWLASPPKAVVEELRRPGRWLRSLGPRAAPEAPAERGEPSHARGFSGPISTAILVLGFVIVAASAAPVVAYGEYATTGPNVDAFPLPPGLPALSSYFAQGFAGAQYRVLAVPMSSEIGVPWTVPSGSFLDTSGLLGSYIPYPVLQEDDGFLPGALMDWFATTPSTNYTEVFEALHLRAVVVDPFAPLGDHSIGTSPDGHPVNWTHVEAVLNASLGTAQDVGGFSVYPVPAAQPFLWLESNLTTVLTPTFGDYLALLANVSASDPIGSYLDDALWTNDSEASPDGLAVTPVVGASTMVDVPWGGSARAMLENGTSVPVPGAEAAAVGVTESSGTEGGAPVHEVTAATPLLASLSNASSYSTDLVAGSGGLTGPTGGNGTFSFRGTFASPILASVNLSLSLHPGGNWATLDLVGTRATVQAQIYENTGTGASTLGLAAFDAAGTPFAWSNAPLPFGSAPLAFTLSVEDSGGVLSAHLRGSGGVPEVNATIWFQGAANLSLDPGHNVSALPPGATGGDPVAVHLSTVYTGVTLSAFSVHRSEPVVAIAAFAGVNRSTVVPCQLTQGITGSWTVTPEEMTGAPAYLALDLPQFWAWTVSGGPSAPTTPSVSNQSNVFAFDGAVPSGHALTVSFSSPQLPGFVGSLVELGVGSGILAVGLVRRFRSRSSG